MESIDILKQEESVTQISPTKPGKLKHLIEKMLVTKGYYFSDKLYGFITNTGREFHFKELPISEEYNGWWLVLGREHYFESSKEYPIANRKDLKKALSFEKNRAPYIGITLQHIERLNEFSHRVTVWVIDPNALESVPFNPKLIFPESYLILKALDKKENIATIELQNKTLFITNTALGLFSGLKSKYISSIEAFSLSSGVSIEQNKVKRYLFNNNQLSLLLQKGLEKLETNHFQGFFVSNKKTEWKNYPWKAMIKLVTGVVVLYLLLTSIFLTLNESRLEDTLEIQAEDLNIVLNIQRAYSKQTELHSKLVVPIKEQLAYWNIWPVVLELVRKGVIISNIQYKNQIMILKGSVGGKIKATDVLAILSVNQFVDSPFFSQPVREYRGRELFEINFNIRYSESVKDITQNELVVNNE